MKCLVYKKHVPLVEENDRTGILQRTIDKYSACVEVGKPIDENSACVEVGTTHKHLRRGDKSNNFKNYFSSNDITCEEVKSVDSQRFLHWIHRTCEQQGSQRKKRSGSHKEIPITYGYTQDPFKNRSQNFKPKVKENYPQYLERENKNCYICGDSSHCARDCEKRFKPKESNDHIHNKTNVNTLKIESEKQNSDECSNLQYVNIFVENQPVTALIDSGCQIPVLNSSLIRVQTPSEEIITLSSCFGEQRMVEVKPINISLNQQSPSLSVRTAISPTLTEEFIIHPSIYSEIEKLGHAKSDVLLSESESSLSADYGVSFPNVSVSNVIKNCSYDLPYVKNFNTRNDLSSLIKKANGAMKTSSVEFISRSPNPLPMKSEHHRFVLLRRIFEPWQWKRRKKRNRFEQTSRTLQRKISMRSTKDQLVKKDVLLPVKQCVFLWNLPDVEEVPSHDGETV
ncbi:phosphatase and actin regulator 2 [Trichonephila clavipes]|nr:phosphatase and actin regulator 2 [Trichonephila clavipes]